MTRRSLKPSDVLLVGVLYMHRRGMPLGRPYLGLEVWCPFCKSTHVHEWQDPPFRADVVTHRAAHCHGDTTGRGGYWIGLDPGHAPHNKRVRDEAEAALARYHEITIVPDLRHGPRIDTLHPGGTLT